MDGAGALAEAVADRHIAQAAQQAAGLRIVGHRQRIIDQQAAAGEVQAAARAQAIKHGVAGRRRVHHVAGAGREIGRQHIGAAWRHAAFPVGGVAPQATGRADPGRQGALGNAGLGHAAGRGQSVVAGIRARQAKAADIDRLAAAIVAVGKRAAAARQADGILADHARHGAADIGHLRAVVHLVAGADAGQCQCRAGNSGRGRASRVGQAVVTSIVTGQAGILYRDRLAAACILVGKRRAGQCAQHIAGDAVVADRHLRAGHAVIHLVDTRIAQVQRTLRDAGHCRATGRAQGVIACVKAGQAGVLHRHDFVAAGILVGECAAGRCRQHVVGDTIIGNRQ